MVTDVSTLTETLSLHGEDVCIDSAPFLIVPDEKILPMLFDAMLDSESESSCKDSLSGKFAVVSELFNFEPYMIWAV
jgi:hypothetical protein